MSFARPATAASSSRVTLKAGDALAVVLPAPIGDSLIGLVLVNNLIRNGYQPVVFGRVANDLADWFPQVTVARPEHHERAFDTVIELRSTGYAATLSRTGKTLCLADLPEYGGSKHMVNRIVEIAANVFGLRDVTRSNGLVVPEGVMRARGQSRRDLSDRQPPGKDVERLQVPGAGTRSPVII